MRKQTPLIELLAKRGQDAPAFVADAACLDREPRLELDPERDMSEGLHPATVAAWNKWVGQSPSAFCDAVLDGLPGQLKITMRISKDGAGSLEIGPQAGTIQQYRAIRSFDARTGEASHQQQHLADHLQGQGLAAKAFVNLLPFYRNLGIHRIQVQARGVHAARIWARYGFLPSADSWNELRETIVNRMRDKVTAARLTKQGPRALWDIADSADGEALLRDAEFDGSLDFRNPSQLSRLMDRLRPAGLPDHAVDIGIKPKP